MNKHLKEETVSRSGCKMNDDIGLNLNSDNVNIQDYPVCGVGGAIKYKMNRADGIAKVCMQPLKGSNTPELVNYITKSEKESLMWESIVPTL